MSFDNITPTSRLLEAKKQVNIAKECLDRESPAASDLTEISDRIGDIIETLETSTVSGGELTSDTGETTSVKSEDEDPV
jgi:hypothetical protein